MTLVSLKAIIPPHMNAIYFPLKPVFCLPFFAAARRYSSQGFIFTIHPYPCSTPAFSLPPHRALYVLELLSVQHVLFLHLKREDGGSRLCINEQKFSLLLTPLSYCNSSRSSSGFIKSVPDFVLIRKRYTHY